MVIGWTRRWSEWPVGFQPFHLYVRQVSLTGLFAISTFVVFACDLKIFLHRSRSARVVQLYTDHTHNRLICVLRLLCTNIWIRNNHTAMTNNRNAHALVVCMLCAICVFIQSQRAPSFINCIKHVRIGLCALLRHISISRSRCAPRNANAMACYI